MPQNLSETSLQTETRPESIVAEGEKPATAGLTGRERYAAARRKLQEHLAVTREDLGQLRRKAVDYSQSAARATNTYAHDHPWTTAGAAVGLGALIGWLVSRSWDMRS